MKNIKYVFVYGCVEIMPRNQIARPKSVSIFNFSTYFIKIKKPSNVSGTKNAVIYSLKMPTILRWI